MIRIFVTEEPVAITCTVDGELVGDSVAVVETCIHQAIAKGRPVHLFLRDVSHIDEVGRTLLSRLATNGVRLRASGVYNSYIVAEVCRERSMAPPVTTAWSAPTRDIGSRLGT